MRVIEEDCLGHCRARLAAPGMMRIDALTKGPASPAGPFRSRNRTFPRVLVHGPAFGALDGLSAPRTNLPAVLQAVASARVCPGPFRARHAASPCHGVVRVVTPGPRTLEEIMHIYAVEADGLMQFVRLCETLVPVAREQIMRRFESGESADENQIVASVA